MTIRKSRILTLALAAAGIALFQSRPSAAQADLNPPMPNVMLLVDSSGSMERKASDDQFPMCDPTGAQASERSRWIDAMEVLTGSIQDYRCESVDRGSNAFKQEYTLSGPPPYDFQYALPYHRPLSGTCTPGPGVKPSPNAYDYPTGAIFYHEYNSANTSCSTFSQSNDGILDAFAPAMRFGLMTFDNLTDAGTGVDSSSPYSPQYNDGNKGAWSYFLNTSAKGKPASCSFLFDEEVGARNAAAPPWEGRMVAFGDPNASSAAVTAKNAQIQEILLASRAFGATPMAGLMDDVRTFFWKDTRPDPLNSALQFAPKNDPFVVNGCRKQAVILLSDGEPNLDLRPFCEGLGPPAGQCPFQKPEDIAFELANPTDPSNPRIPTYVIGFVPSNITVGAQSVDCTQLSDAALTDLAGLCAQNPNEKKLQACCTLNRIAFNGGTNRAYFATTKQELRSQLSNILSANAPTTSRTQPAFAASSSVRDPFAGSYRFFSSFKPKQLSLWSGVLERERFICKKDPGTGKVLPESQGIRSELGDDFIANVNSGAGPARLFVSAAGTLANGVIHSERSIRPTYPGSNPDGTGVYVGSQYQGDPATFTSNTPPESMAITSTTCAGLSASQCRDLYMRWNVGLNNGTQYQRCSAPGTSTCNLIADIFHSTPRLVNHPQEFIRDESYTAFSASKAPRPLMLYASSNDGVLHAFKVAPNDPADLPVNTLSNNELWAFIPPAVLPLIPSQYPNAHQILLDGVPVIKDVAAVDTGGGNFVFERSGTQAQSGSGTWRTVLVQSFGGARGGYFALDITDPVPGNTGGPRFLWQLTQDASGNPLFGLKGGTPLVTTLFFDVGGGEIKEVPVAILPGGDGGTPTGASCARKQTSYSNVDSGYQPRSNVNCYPVAGIGGRSLTVARLDTGEIIRSFRNSAADAPASLAGRVTETVIDSPITGQPVPFPAETGAVADRIYIGDQDGTLWKLDVSSTDSTKWKMELIFDAYPSSLSHAFGDGQPIATPPILSVDESGNITAAISTGDQEVFTSSSSVNYVWSFTEKPNASGTGLVSKVNWYKKFTSGERVTGPMTLFNRGLYFSTFQPASSAAACSVGASALWGMDYLTKSTAGIDQGGLEVLPDPADPTKQVQRIDVSALLNQPNGTVFGVGITQQPTCDSVDTGFNDPFLGFGAHTALTNVEPGKFQLVAQTGGAGTPITGGSTNALTVDLATPSLTAQVDSWAAIIE